MELLNFKQIPAIIFISLGWISIAGAQAINNVPVSKLHRNFLHHAGNSLIHSDAEKKIPPRIQFQKTMGGTGDDFCFGDNIVRMPDGSIIAMGETKSVDGDFTQNKGGYDAFVIKLDEKGTIIWQKTYGGSGDDNFATVVQNKDGSYVAIGNTTSNDGNVAGNHGGSDVWMVKLSADGNFLSQKCYGGTGDDNGTGLVKTDDGFVFSGFVNSTDNDVTVGDGNYDGWVVKINNSGNIAWQKAFAGFNYNELLKIVQTRSKGLFVFGTTLTDVVAGNHGGYDAVLIKMSQSGNVAWMKCIGGSGDEFGNDFAVTPDDHLILAMGCSSNDGDFSINKGGFDTWVEKISSSSGAVIFAKNLGTSRDDVAFGITSLTNGGYAVLGAVGDANDETTIDAQAHKLDAIGKELWVVTMGGSDYDDMDGAIETTGGGLLIAGLTSSYDGDITGQHGPSDIWLVKFKAEGERKDANEAFRSIPKLGNNTQTELKTYPNPVSNSTTISFTLPHPQKVSASIFDLNGRLIKTLADAQLQAGIHQITWDRKDDKGSAVSAGIYCLRLEAKDYSETMRLIILK